jgi:hypothetical protein
MVAIVAGLLPGISNRAVVKAGKLLRGHHETPSTELIEAFRIAHAWRDAHALPMRRIRQEVARKARQVDPAAVTPGRMKRMKSIRKKLRRQAWDLLQIQDIGGCRAIASGPTELSEILRHFKEGCRHELVAEHDHISFPKLDGYRSHHLVLRYRPSDGDGPETAQLIEVQLRTRLQHAWATAVEAVGLVRGEDLKGGGGSAEWLRLFALMGTELSLEEGFAAVPGTPLCARERRHEMRGLEGRLDAIANLDSFRRIIDRTSAAQASPGQVFLIQYDNSNMTVSAKPFSSLAAGAQSYEAAERGGAVDTVLVELDRAADLRQAYPNYYLDVGLFTKRLARMLPEPQAAKVRFDWIDRWKARSRGVKP